MKAYSLRADILQDIGAYKGLFSKAANDYFEFEKTICFEPNQELHKAILNHNSQHEIIIEDLALDSKKGIADYYLH